MQVVGGGGGVEVKWKHRIRYFRCSLKAVVPCSNIISSTQFLSSTHFILPSKLLIGFFFFFFFFFFFVNLAGYIKMH